jgi:hypothetical protein
MDHEVLDFPRMISKLEGMNMRPKNSKADPETTIMEEPRKNQRKYCYR